MTDEIMFAFRRGRDFLSLNVSSDESRKLPSFIILWLPGVVFWELREPWYDSLRSAQPQIPSQLTRNPSSLLLKMEQIFLNCRHSQWCETLRNSDKYLKRAKTIYCKTVAPHACLATACSRKGPGGTSSHNYVSTGGYKWSYVGLDKVRKSSGL